jgi:hypothetical protein
MAAGYLKTDVGPVLTPLAAAVMSLQPAVAVDIALALLRCGFKSQQWDLGLMRCVERGEG